MGFNRTFMELKSILAQSDIKRRSVLIVPLWNWNMGIDKNLTPEEYSFNRTFMELKFQKIPSERNGDKF